jgi:hypothetical protein
MLAADITAAIAVAEDTGAVAAAAGTLLAVTAGVATDNGERF